MSHGLLLRVNHNTDFHAHDLEGSEGKPVNSSREGSDVEPFAFWPTPRGLITYEHVPEPGKASNFK